MIYLEKPNIEDLQSLEFIQKYREFWQNDELTYRPFLHLKTKECLQPNCLTLLDAQNLPIGFAHVDKSDQLLLSPMSRQAAMGLCQYLREHKIEFPGIFGPERQAEILVDCLQETCGTTFHVVKRLLHWHICKLSSKPKTLGSARLATLKDYDVLVKMFEDMQRETNTQRPFDVHALVETKINCRELFVWETANNEVACVSIATLGATQSRYGTIERVFTPRRYRENGFAHALTWHAANHILKRKTGIFLSSDAQEAAPTKLYKRLGFKVHSTMINWRRSLANTPNKKGQPEG